MTNYANKLYSFILHFNVNTEQLSKTITINKFSMDRNSVLSN